MTSARFRSKASSIHVGLAVAYAVAFVVMGAVMLAVNASLLASRLPADSDGIGIEELVDGAVADLPGESHTVSVTVEEASAVTGDAVTVTDIDLTELATDITDVGISAYRDEALHTLAGQSGLVLLGGGVLAVAGGALLSRRALRPVTVMTATARRLSDADLGRRIPVEGPRDEVRELAETFNAMLDRLQDAFERERRLMSNIAHELRTPLANQRVALEVGLADPEVAPGAPPAGRAVALTAMAERALAQNLRAHRLIESLLLLARADNAAAVGSSDADEPADLAVLAANAVDAVTLAVPATRSLSVDTDLRHCPVHGDPLLLERLVANLVENAVRHDVAAGWVRVATAVIPGGAVLEVANSGPVVPEADVPGLFEPFRRRAGDRLRSKDGTGLGLAIVRSVVMRHRGALDVTPNPGGGLQVLVTLPAKSPDPPPAATAPGAARGGRAPGPDRSGSRAA